MARIALRTDAGARLSVADLGVRRVGMTAQTRVFRATFTRPAGAYVVYQVTG